MEGAFDLGQYHSGFVRFSTIRFFGNQDRRARVASVCEVKA